MGRPPEAPPSSWSDVSIRISQVDVSYTSRLVHALITCATGELGKAGHEVPPGWAEFFVKTNARGDPTGNVLACFTEPQTARAFFHHYTDLHWPNEAMTQTAVLSLGNPTFEAERHLHAIRVVSGRRVLTCGDCEMTAQ